MEAGQLIDAPIASSGQSCLRSGEARDLSPTSSSSSSAQPGTTQRLPHAQSDGSVFPSPFCRAAKTSGVVDKEPKPLTSACLGPRPLGRCNSQANSASGRKFALKQRCPVVLLSSVDGVASARQALIDLGFGISLSFSWEVDVE